MNSNLEALKGHIEERLDQLHGVSDPTILADGWWKLIRWMLDEGATLLEDHICQTGYRASYLLGDYHYQVSIERPNSPERTVANGCQKKYRWKATDADAAELIYALKGKGVIEVNGAPAEIKDLVGMFKDVFDKKMANVYYTKMTNMRRKKDKAPFLNGLIKVLVAGGNEERKDQ